MNANMKKCKPWLSFIFWILLCQLPAFIGTGAVQNHLDWYHSLRQPPFAPPDWLFGIMWGILYILMGVTGFLISRRGGNAANTSLFILQLLLNAAWTPVFFAAHAPATALAILLAMLLCAGWLAARLSKENRTAAYLLLPYLLWLLFAGYLNAGIWWIN